MVYRGLTFTQRNPPTEEEVATYVEWFGRPFPKQYVEFLKAVNGGRPQADSFTYRSAKTGKKLIKSVEVFYGLRKCEFSLKWAFETYIESGRMPRHFLPVAQLEGSDVIYIDSETEKVFSWMSEGEGEGTEPENCSLVANTFDDFLGMFNKV